MLALTNSVWNSCAVIVPVAVTLTNVGELVEPSPCMLPEPAKMLPVDVLVVILVENEPLSVFSAEILEVAAVILVEKDPLSVFSAEILEVAAVILVENELDAVVNELADASFLVTLVENEELAAVNEPLILVAI